MKKKNWILYTGAALLIAAGFIVLTSSSSPVKKEVSPTCCKKADMECKPELRESGPVELNMDNMSRQFISVTPFSY